MINLIVNNAYNNVTYDNVIRGLSIIRLIEDIIDALFSGVSFGFGLRAIKDDVSLKNSSEKTAGHGCDYFERPGSEFEEIIANYYAISLIEPNNRIFIFLKNLLEREFVEFLDTHCQKISKYKLEKNYTSASFKP